MKFALAVLALLVCRFALAQESEGLPGNKLPPLPAAPQQWINSTPLTPEILKDKAVVFWYFEETCPSCEKKWPGLLEIAQKYEGQPVLFVAVNSGSPRQQIEQYARRNKINWPILLDPDRSFESQSGVGEISLQNIYQVRGLSGDGEFTPSRGGEIAEVAEAIASSGKWHVDPKEIPAALQPAWQAVEFGNFSAAAQMLKKNAASPKEDIKEAVAKLQGVVDAEIEGGLKRAAEAKESGKTWVAYKELGTLQTRFKGYTLPASVAADIKDLKNDEQIKKELNAAKAFDTLKQKVSGGKFPPKSVRAQMEKFLEQYPGTEAAEEVTAALARFDSAAGGQPGNSEPGNANGAEKK